MTMDPEIVDPKTPITPKVDVEETATLEDMFLLGYTKSDKITIYDDGDKKLTVTFRTILPTELRDIFEISSRFDSFEARTISERLETLARAIVTVNDMPLVMDQEEKKTFKEYHKEEPSSLDQARHILVNKIKSPYIIEFLYEAYIEFSDTVKDHFEDIKKKLKNQKSSE